MKKTLIFLLGVFLSVNLSFAAVTGGSSQQVLNNLYLRLDGTTTMTGNLNMSTNGVIDFGGGNYSITHSTDNLAFSKKALFQGRLRIDKDSTEALLVRKDGDLGDVFAVDTINDTIYLPQTGSVINWASGDVTLTHSAGLLTNSGDFTVGGTLKVLGDSVFDDQATFDLAVWIDSSISEAFLVRKNGDTGDVFAVNSSTRGAILTLDAAGQLLIDATVDRTDLTKPAVMLNVDLGANSVSGFNIAAVSQGNYTSVTAANIATTSGGMTGANFSTIGIRSALTDNAADVASSSMLAFVADVDAAHAGAGNYVAYSTNTGFDSAWISKSGGADWTYVFSEDSNVYDGWNLNATVDGDLDGDGSALEINVSPFANGNTKDISINGVAVSMSGSANDTAATYVAFAADSFASGGGAGEATAFLVGTAFNLAFDIESGGEVHSRTANGAGAYTTLISDYYIGKTGITGGGDTITLGSDTVSAGAIVIIKDESGTAGTNNITIATEAAETIDGAATKVISTNYGSVRLISDGTNWFTF